MLLKRIDDENEYFIRRGRDLRIIAKAILEAQEGRHKLCAIATRNGVISSVGVNSYAKTHPFQGKLARMCGMQDRVFLHAEIAALLKAREADTLYVFRLGRKGFALAKPCPICQLACEMKGIKNVFYS